jgi:hypothetical protein
MDSIGKRTNKTREERERERKHNEQKNIVVHVAVVFAVTYPST